jgi:ABC-type oligopeptide transport system substrate-binding subunit
MPYNGTRRVVALAAALLAAGLAGVGCTVPSASSASEKPAKIEKIDGSEVSRVVLTGPAAERLNIQTDTVRQAQVTQQASKVIPYAAVVYDADGGAWTYTTSKELTYQREPITIASITGNLAVLSSGPAEGTTVVTTGAAELYGAELGVGK